MLVAVLSLVVLAGVTGALVWFQPHKLFVDERVDDALPEVTAGPSTSVAAGPAQLAAGNFVSIDHDTSGAVRVLELPGSGRIVRLEGLDTSNGPDLFLYLSTTSAGGSEATFDDDFVNLGRLKGNQGDQNYDLPAEVDLSRYKSVVIWCDRFNSAFGAADLSPA